jgi:hypothetical protein
MSTVSIMAPARKKAKGDKAGTIRGSSIRYDERTNSFLRGKSYVNFGEGDSRVYDVSNAFLRADVSFEILSEVNRVLTVGNPRSLSGKLSGKGIQVCWVLNRFDKRFIKRCSEGDMARILRRLETRCDSECLRGVSYRNEYQDNVTIHMDGASLREMCGIMGQEPRPVYVRGADILNRKNKGHRSNGDSVVKVSSIPEDDMEAYMVMVRERILRAQKVDGQEYLITTQVDDAEETLVRSLHELSRKFDSPEVSVGNDGDGPDGPDGTEVLIPEQLEACNIAMNNPVSYLTGFPGSGKTSCLCRILRESNGTVILTPSHVSREVVCQRAEQNGIDPASFSVEVLAFAVRHVQEWLPGSDPSGEHVISPRSVDFMSKFKGDDDRLQIETLVLEEASMCDIFQASSVIYQFCQIESLKRILFCGDQRQLQSVSKGRVLEDVIQCGSIPGKVLEVNHRSGSALSANLRHILKSSLLNVEEDSTFEIMDCPLDLCDVETDFYGRDRVMALQPIVDVFMDHRDRGLPTHVFGYTNIECNRINECLKTAIFGSGSDTVMFPDGCKVRIKDTDIITPSSRFHRNDFVEIVRNEGPKHFVVKRWNNKIRETSKDVQDVQGLQDSEDAVDLVDSDDDSQDSEVLVDAAELPEEEELFEIKVTGRLKEALALGYASSVHSFQGSECPYVIVHGVPNSSYFSRNALYTAMSRGKKKCIIVTCAQSRYNWKRIVYKRAVARLSNLARRL